jgi:hypothetical protein
MATEPSIADFFRDLPRNWKSVCTAIFSYVLIGIVGMAILSCFTDLYKTGVAQNTVSRAEQLSGSQPGEALDQMTQIEPWAISHRTLEYRLACDVIRCHIMLGDFTSAARTARELANRYDKTKVQAASGPMYLLRALRSGIVEMFIQGPDTGAPLSEWCGYDVLINELRAMGGHDDLLKEIAKELPQNYQPSLTQHPVNNQIPEQAVKIVQRTVNHTVNEQSESPESAGAVRAGAPPDETSHYELALKHIALQNWDDALRECELLLSTTPNDLRTASLKNIAKGRGKGWGAVKTANTKACNCASPALPCKVAAGTLVDILQVKRGQDDVMAVCNVVNEGTEVSKLLIPVRDLEIGAGSLLQVTEQLKKLEIIKAQLIAQLEEAKLALVRKKDEMNPSSKEYAAAKAAYDGFWVKVRDLTGKADASKDDARSKYLDELQRMKLAENRVEQTYKTANKKYKDWEDAHPLGAEDTAGISGLESSLAGVQTQIRQLEQGQ